LTGVSAKGSRKSIDYRQAKTQRGPWLSPAISAGLVAVLGRLLHNDPAVGALTGANHHAAMVFVEGNALESAGRLRATG